MEHMDTPNTLGESMKILLVHNRYQQAGGEDVVFQQEKKNLERAGHHVVTYERSNHEIEQFSALQRAMLVKRIVWAADSRREFDQLLAREAPDLVHVHNTFLMISPSIYSACRDHGVPVVQTLHNYRLMCPGALFLRDGRVCEDCVEHSVWRGVRHGCYRDSHIETAGVALMLAWHRQTKTYQKLLDCLVAGTEFARTKFVAAGFDANKIVVKPNFVDPDPGPRERIGDYAVFAGRLSQEKGIATILDAWEHLSPHCALKIVGDGPLRASLEAQAKERGLSGVTFCGRISRDETIETVKGARFQITPSIWYEAFPMVIVEAFACGVPVLCSRLGGMQEIVTDHCTGLHFTPGDAQDLADKVEWAWNHPAELAEMGRAARRKYEADYTAEKNYSLLMGIYEQTVATYA
jgi:glycosyltransferase involved in cell wall biosynthesis